jgi:hypothetical protein
MPGPSPLATRAVDTLLWDTATGARPMLIAHPDSARRCAALAALYATVAAAPDVSVWADRHTHHSVPLPDQLPFGYYASGAGADAGDARAVLRLASELDTVRRSWLNHAGRWLFAPRVAARMIMVVVDLATVRPDQLPPTLATLADLAASGHRTAMPTITLVDPTALRPDDLDALTRASTPWLPPARPAPAPARALATASA